MHISQFFLNRIFYSHLHPAPAAIGGEIVARRCFDSISPHCICCLFACSTPSYHHALNYCADLVLLFYSLALSLFFSFLDICVSVLWLFSCFSVVWLILSKHSNFLCLLTLVSGDLLLSLVFFSLRVCLHYNITTALFLSFCVEFVSYKNQFLCFHSLSIYLSFAFDFTLFAFVLFS